MPCDEQPIHSARSFALASDVDSATMRHFESIWLEMYRMREITTSRIGPTCVAMATMMRVLGAHFDDAVHLGGGHLAAISPRSRAHLGGPRRR